VSIGYQDKATGGRQRGGGTSARGPAKRFSRATLSSRFYYVHAIDYDRGGEMAGKSSMCTVDSPSQFAAYRTACGAAIRALASSRWHARVQGLDHSPDRSQRRGRKTK